MKKFVKVLLILAACLACLGVVLTAVGGFWSARVYNRLIPEEAVSISFPLNADTLSSLTLNVGVGEVRFAEAPSPEAARMDTEGFSEGDFTFSENKQGEVVLCSRSMLGGESIFNLGFLRMDWLGRLHTGCSTPSPRSTVASTTGSWAIRPVSSSPLAPRSSTRAAGSAPHRGRHRRYRRHAARLCSRTFHLLRHGQRQTQRPSRR